jgi:predicted RND superfamily exporter protein
MATSSTTALAFLSNGFSSLMPVSAFGWFAFVIIPVNYILIVFYYPAYLIVYENSVRNIENKCLKKLQSCITCKSCRETNCKTLFLILFLN